MPRARLSEEETRELILSEAYNLFNDIGYRKTTIGDIAKACGFSAANVHKHFGTKSAINQEIARVMMEEILDEAHDAIARHRSAAKKLRTFVTTVHASTVESFRHKKRAFETLSAAAEEKWEAVREYRLSLRDMLTKIIDDGVQTGEFKAINVDKTVAAIHMSLVRVFHPANIVEMMGEPDAGDVDTLVDFILVGLRKA